MSTVGPLMPGRVLEALLLPAAFAARASAAACRHPHLRETFLQLLRLLRRSLPVVMIVAGFSGAMLTVQAVRALSLIGGGPLAGTLVGIGGVREVFPLLAAAALAARTGAEFASELGTMRVTQQLDALDAMGIDAIPLLIAPRLVAATLGAPLCVWAADGAGLWGAYAVGVWQLGIDPGDMATSLRSAFEIRDVYLGMARGLVLGWLVGALTTYEGYAASGGTRGVGRATNRAVVRAMVAVCLTSVCLTFAIYGPAALRGE